MPAAPVVLDSFAFVTWFRDEQWAAFVETLLTKPPATDRPVPMIELSYAEVKYTLIGKDAPKVWAATAQVLAGLPVEFYPVTRQLADLAADYKAAYKMSMADAFVAALAKVKGAKLVTGDTDFNVLEKEIKIQWLK